MPITNIVIHASGEILTGRLWRRDLSLFNSLPFYTDIPRMDEMAGPLEKALADINGKGPFFTLLLVRRPLLLPTD
jgi:hypothetical protein